VLTESAVDPNATPVYDARNHSLVLFDQGDEIVVQAGRRGFGFCWYRDSRWKSRWRGRADCDEYPAELRQAMWELQTNSFIRHK